MRYTCSRQWMLPVTVSVSAVLLHKGRTHLQIRMIILPSHVSGRSSDP